MRRLIFHRRIPSEKAIEWRGTSYDDLCAFPDAARRIAGFQLGRLQEGKEPDDWKPMPVVGVGTIEIRIRARAAHRIFLVTKFDEAIYVLHAFEKKSQETSKNDISLAKRRYRELIAERSKR